MVRTFIFIISEDSKQMTADDLWKVIQCTIYDVKAAEVGTENFTREMAEDISSRCQILFSIDNFPKIKRGKTKDGHNFMMFDLEV